MTRLATLLACLLLVAACSRSDPSASTLASDNPAPGFRSGSADAAGSFAPGSQEALEAEAGDTVFFAFDSSSLRPESQAVVRQQATWLQQNPGVTVTITGHADERGTREYNLALGDRRANAVRSFLMGLGIAPDRIQTLSFGEERPAVVGSNPQSWARNRRAMTTIDVTS